MLDVRSCTFGKALTVFRPVGVVRSFQVSGGSVELDKLAVLESGSGVAASHHCRYSVFPGDDGGVSEGATDVGHHCVSGFDERRCTGRTLRVWSLHLSHRPPPLQTRESRFYSVVKDPSVQAPSRKCSAVLSATSWMLTRPVPREGGLQTPRIALTVTPRPMSGRTRRPAVGLGRQSGAQRFEVFAEAATDRQNVLVAHGRTSPSGAERRWAS